MRSLYLLLAVFGLFSACRQDPNSQQNSISAADQLSLPAETRPEWQYENLRLYPVLASEPFLAANEAAGQLKTLAEVIENYGFRISEKKPYGRFEDENAVNKLTVQNKTEDAVLLLGGDIVQGGRQDRVVGDDQVIAARSLKDIEVFCVERGRWTFHGTTDEEAVSKPQQDKIFAFSGYYHVASGGIRQTLAKSKDQNEVWDKVNQLTSEHEVESQTGAYASLENSEAFTGRRDAYLRFFDGKFADLDQVVGVVAVTGQRVIGIDVFGHPGLFQRHLPSLLHSYATDAITQGEPVVLSQTTVDRQLKKLNKGLNDPQVLRYQGALVHYYQQSTATE